MEARPQNPQRTLPEGMPFYPGDIVDHTTYDYMSKYRGGVVRWCRVVSGCPKRYRVGVTWPEIAKAKKSRWDSSGKASYLSSSLRLVTPAFQGGTWPGSPQPGVDLSTRAEYV